MTHPKPDDSNGLTSQGLTNAMVNSGFESLSARQLEVLELICQGLKSTSIGDRLNISYETVKSHRSAIMRRLGVANALELVTLYNQITSVKRPYHLRSSPKVLIVEDEIVFRELLVSGLRQLGFECEGIGSRKAFDEAFSTIDPDIVILDLNLGPDDGLEIAKYLKAESTCGIIIMTTRGEIENRIAGLAVGADTYMVKPIDLREMTGVIRNLYSKMQVR